jgi:hypothetical protein
MDLSTLSAEFIAIATSLAQTIGGRKPVALTHMLREEMVDIVAIEDQLEVFEELPHPQMVTRTENAIIGGRSSDAASGESCSHQ